MLGMPGLSPSPPPISDLNMFGMYFRSACSPAKLYSAMFCYSTLHSHACPFGILNIPMDDSVAESPHAIAARISKHSRRSGFPWVSSSMRLKQNLSNYRDMFGAFNVDINKIWRGYKSILQTDEKKSRLFVPKQISPTAFVSTVYHLSHLYLASRDATDARIQALCDGPGGDNPGDGGEGPAGEGGPHGDDDDDIPDGGGGGDDDGDDHDGDGGGGGGGRPAGASISRNSTESKLLRQFLNASLDLHSYVSIPMETEEGPPTTFFFQVLALETRNVFVETHEHSEDELFNITVQPLERWAPLSKQADYSQSVHACFVYAEPQAVDILTLTGGRRSALADFKVRGNFINGR
jgi:hypothetical protein